MLSNNKIESNQIKIEGIIYNIEDFRKICSLKNAVFADLKALYDKKTFISAGFDVFRL